jgi:dipeptidase E
VKRLLLLSNSTNFQQGYLDHAEAEIRALFAGARRIAFVPFALHDRQAYFAKARARFERFAIALEQATPDAGGRELVAAADGVFVGGGNTFRLLDALQKSGVDQVLRERALAGMPYLGASAGTNIAAPTIKTTNDMPIVSPASLEALGLIGFQVNPHYLDSETRSRHMGETREDRLREYLEENETPVVGIREGAWLEVDGAGVKLGGSNGGRLFRRGNAPLELEAGTRLDALLGESLA